MFLRAYSQADSEAGEIRRRFLNRKAVKVINGGNIKITYFGCC